MSEIKTAEQRIHKLEGADMKTEDVKTWNECVLTPIVKECDELRAALAERDAKLAALEKQGPVAYRFPKAGVDNGYNYCDSLDAEEPRFLKLWEKLYAAAGAAPNAWKDAILEVMTIYGMDAPITDAPEKIIKDLIELATIVAMDPTLAAGAAPVPEGWQLVPVEALTRWRTAFAEGLAAWDIDPPLHHVQTSHDEISALLAAPKEPT